MGVGDDDGSGKLGHYRLVGVGKLSNRPDTAEKGKSALIWSLGDVIVTAIAIPLVNSVFGAAA